MKTIQYVLTIHSWHVFDLDTIELVAHIVYWEHIKLALSKGFTAATAKDHVYQFLTNSENKSNVIGIIENYLKSFSFNFKHNS